MKKRILSVLLALVMVVSLLPMAVFADDPVAKIGETPYGTLQAAINAATEAETTIQLIANTKENVTIAANQNIILDLNGCTLNGGTTSRKAALTNNGTVIIQDSSAEQTGAIQREDTTKAGCYYTIQNDGTMTITAGKVYNHAGGDDTTPWSGASLICNGGYAKATLTITGGVISQDYFIAIKNDAFGTLNFAGGTLTSKTQAIQNWNVAEVSGGELNGALCTWSYSTDASTHYAGLMTISGDAKITGNVESVQLKYSGIDAGAPAKVIIKGGSIIGSVVARAQGGTPQTEAELTVFGGEFSKSVNSKYLDRSLNYEAHNGNDMYSYHATATDAANAAGVDGTVTNLTGDTPTDVITIFFDLNGAAGSIAPAYVGENGDVQNWPTDPTREGYVFLGWYLGDEKVTSNTAFTENTTVTARWMPVAIIGGISQIVTGAGSMMQHFVDVTSMDYYFDAVQWAVESGITTGTSKLMFSPDAPCTRAQAVTFLWRAMGSRRAENAANFTDVKADAYYADAVAWAVEKGITVGTSDTTFSPDAPCTRAQIVTFLYRAIGVKSTVEAGFSDVAANAYYAEAINWAAQYGITGGTGANRFSPDMTCTRAQIVTFLYRAN